MARARLAYLPLTTYPDVAPNECVAATMSIAAALGCELHARTFSAEIPRASSALGTTLLNIPDMIRTTEEKSREHCRRLEKLMRQQAGATLRLECTTSALSPGLTSDAAAAEARYFDLALLPWAKDRLPLQELAQAVIFGAGRPAILVPPSAGTIAIGHVAVAWDGTRVAARALSDAMPLVADDTRITVLMVQNEKHLDQQDLAVVLSRSLQKRGLAAEAKSVSLDDKAIADVLQTAAIEAGADLLVMGGFGHSRLRDFVLGGATKGIFRRPPDAGAALALGEQPGRYSRAGTAFR